LISASYGKNLLTVELRHDDVELAQLIMLTEDIFDGVRPIVYRKEYDCCLDLSRVKICFPVGEYFLD